MGEPANIDASERADAMVAEGRRIVNDAIKEYRPVAVVAAYSGGDDSIVSTHFAMDALGGCVAFNADTRVGLAPTRRHIKATCERFAWPLEIGEATPEGPPEKMREKDSGEMVPFDPAVLPAGRWADGDSAYEEYALNQGFPGRNKIQHARMYQRLKERPLRRLVRELKAGRRGSKVLIVSGIRGDESAIRAGYKAAVNVAGDQVWVNPFYWRSAADFALYRDEFGLPGNPVKRTCGISGECMCATFPGPDERAAASAADPKFISYIEGLEARVAANGFPWRWGQSPPRWWVDARRGQAFLFDSHEPGGFQPMCIGCARRGGR